MEAISNLNERSRLLTGLALFVICYAAFDILPVFLTQEVGYSGLRVGDVLDAPLVALPIGAYLLLGWQAALWRTATSKVIGAVGVLLFVQGHAIHLAANAIAASSDSSQSSWDTTYFLDEHWGHVELHLAILLLAALFIVASRAGSVMHETLSYHVAFFGLATSYGVLLAADAVEGQTVPLMLPGAVLLVLLSLIGRSQPQSAHRSFFASALAVTVISLAAYGVINSGYPELSFL